MSRYDLPIGALTDGPSSHPSDGVESLQESVPPARRQPSLLKAAVTAGFWTLAGHGAGQVLRLLGNLLLTRLLAPELFGVMGVATVISVGVVMFSDLGLRQVIVRSRQAHDPTFVNTVWTLQIMQGVLVAAVLLLIAAGTALAQHQGAIAPASTYASADLPLLIAGLAVSAIIAGTESTKLATAEKAMLVRPVVLIEVGSQVVGLLAMVLIARVYPTVYVLLVGALISGVVKAVGSHLLPVGSPNRLKLSWPVVREVCQVSSWIVVSSALGFLSANVDKLILAGLLGSHVMGQIVIASLLVGAVSDVVLRVSGRVAFPAMAKAYEHDRDSLVRSYYRSRMLIDAACLSVAAVFFWFGPALVRLLYDGRYEQAGQFLSVLGITLLGSRYLVVQYIYLLLGRPRLMAAEQAIRFCAIVIAIVVGYRLYGTMGAIWGGALGQLAGPMAGLLAFQPRLGLVSVRREVVALAAFAGLVALLSIFR